jgi:predicted nucleic acid-binding protein
VTAFYDAQPFHALYISVVNIAEIRFGIELQEDVTRRAELNDWLTRTLRPAFTGRILPVMEDILLKWRTLMEDGRKTGHTYSHPDLLMIAGTGLTVDHTRPERFRQRHECRSSTRGSHNNSRGCWPAGRSHRKAVKCSNPVQRHA